MQFDQFNLYSMKADINKTPRIDEVDTYMDALSRMDEYGEVKEYISSNFGNFEGEKWLNYDKLHKNIYILVEYGKIEFCALKDEQQYFGKGWKLINQK